MKTKPSHRDSSEATQTTVPCQFCGTLNRVDLSRLAHHPTCGDCGKPILLDRPVKVDEAHFEATVLKAPVPVLVDFYADWCGPCRQMAPALDEIARESRGKLLVVKVDTDRSARLAQTYGVRSIPFFARFEGGALERTAVGAVGADALRRLAML
jgi:thioredoxin 2